MGLGKPLSTPATIALMSGKRSKSTKDTPKRSRKRDTAEETTPPSTDKLRALKKPSQPVRTDTKFGTA
jgi:hypothetical protein